MLISTLRTRADRGLTCQNEEEEAYQCAVTEVEYTRRQAPKTDVTKPIDHCICKNIACRGPGSVEGSPLPVIVLTAKQKVNQENRDRGTCNDHNSVADEQKAEHVVNFSRPHILQNEEEFNEDSSEG